MVADNFEGTEYALPYGATPTPIGKTDRYSIFKVRGLGRGKKGKEKKYAGKFESCRLFFY